MLAIYFPHFTCRLPCLASFVPTYLKSLASHGLQSSINQASASHTVPSVNKASFSSAAAAATAAATLLGYSEAVLPLVYSVAASCELLSRRSLMRFPLSPSTDLLCRNLLLSFTPCLSFFLPSSPASLTRSPAVGRAQELAENRE